MVSRPLPSRNDIWSSRPVTRRHFRPKQRHARGPTAPDLLSVSSVQSPQPTGLMTHRPLSRYGG
jgi:hypothetical protein